MNKLKSYIGIIIYLIVCPLYNFANDIFISAGNRSAEKGTQIYLPITIDNQVDDIISISFTLTFDSQIIQYVEVDSFNLPGMSMADFGISEVSEGVFSFSWIENSLAPVDIIAGTKIFVIKFELIGDVGDESTISFGNTPTVTEVVDIGLNQFNATTQDGLIIINAVLPVELNNFNAELINEDVKLTWETLIEINNAGFIIEQSFDGINFREIGSKTGMGNENSLTKYSYLDEAIKERALSNFSYYRLKQVDFDGTSTYSGIEVVDLNIALLKFEISDIHLNRAYEDSILNINYKNPNKSIRRINLIVADLNGRVINNRLINTNNEFGLIQLTMPNNLSGVYILSIDIGKEIITKMMILDIVH